MRLTRPIRAALALALAAVTVAPATAQSAPSTAADGLHGEAVIQPVESDIAAKFWASVTSSSGNASAAMAIDQNAATAWLPDRADRSPSLTLDLGGTYDNVRKVELVFPDRGAAYQYLIDASSDGQRWDRVADRSRNATPGRGAVDLLTRPNTRYLRVTVAGASAGGRPGIAEIRAYNYLREDLVLGADLSWVDNYQTRNYYLNPNPSLQNMGAGPHLLDVARDRGMQFVRLRVFNEPRSEATGLPAATPYQSPARTAEVARWVKERGLQLGVDFHYADSWADPGKQPKPRAWAELDFDALVTALHDYTHAYVRSLVQQGTTPDKIAIGNEIINGMMWGSEGVNPTANPAYFRDQAAVYQSKPGGGIVWRYWGSSNPAEQRLYDESWDRFATLIAAGIRAARSASPESAIELHTIVDSAEEERDGLPKTMEFWHQLLTRVKARGQEPDVLAISYYPQYHGSVEQLDRNLHTIATTYPQYRVNVAETAYPATGGTPQPSSTFPRTIQGQADAIRRVFQAANDVVNNRGVGVLLWEPAGFQSMFRAVPEMPNYFQPNASIDVFTKSRASHVVQSTVYATARVGQASVLPASVRVLTTADGSVRDVPVTWEPAAAAAARAPGEVTFRGTTDYGEVTAVIAVI